MTAIDFEELSKQALKDEPKFQKLVSELDVNFISKCASEGTPFRRQLCLAIMPFLISKPDKEDALLAIYNLEVSISPAETGGLLPNIQKPSIFHVPSSITHSEHVRNITSMTNVYTFRPLKNITRLNFTTIKRRLFLSFQAFISEMPKKTVEEYCKLVQEDDNDMLVFASIRPFIKANYPTVPLKDYKGSSPLESLSLY